MNNRLTNMEEILRRQISGFHQYELGEAIRLCYVSENLCEMIGYDACELLCESEDRYADLVHPADRQRYWEFIRQLTQGVQTHSCEYRLLKKDGGVICVRDSVTTQRAEDGRLIASSVLTDITDLRREQNNLQFLNETVPCGFLKYTCEKQPRITYINQKMIDILRFPDPKDGEPDYLELYKSNVFLMIPMEERASYAKYLSRVYSVEAPIAGEMTLLRCDGTRAHVFGWVTKAVNEQGVEEFQSVCMDVTARHRAKKAAETKRYMKALTDVYDEIFEFNLDANAVKCLHCEATSTFKHFENVSMQMEDALDACLLSVIWEDDRERMRSFFRDFCQKKLYEPDAKPPQISFRARSSDGEYNEYIGIFIQVDDSASLYCCRRVQNTVETESLRIENNLLKENMKDLVMKFSDGLAAFEVTAEGTVKPLYASENVCEFFGYTNEEWLPLTEKHTPIKRFVANSEASYEDFAKLLRTGEAEFTYFDYKSETQRRIRAICSQKEANSRSPRYVMLYSVEDGGQNEKKSLPDNRSVYLRTFGYFDVFVGDKPIAFRNKKAKELFAILVDRRGGFVTSEEAIGFLWEDEPANTVTLSRYRKVALRLKNTLEEYGISDIIEAVDGKRRIVMEKVQCDLYDYLTGKEEHSQLFKGSYLSNYSWAETTLGELMNDQQ